jgi:hypothetical protein
MTAMLDRFLPVAPGSFTQFAAQYGYEAR